MIYSRNKFIFEDTDENNPGLFSAELVIEPNNFQKPFHLYLMVTDKEVMGQFTKLQKSNQICKPEDKYDNMTHLQISADSNKLPLYVQHLANPFQNIILFEKINITKDGEYYAIMCICPEKSELPKKTKVSILNFKVDKSKPYISFDGHLTFKNPNGYLSADRKVHMKYYLLMGAVYIFFGLFWIFKLIQKFDYLISFHHVIS